MLLYLDYCIVTLENDVWHFAQDLGGIYFVSEDVNGKPSWIQMEKYNPSWIIDSSAIWYNADIDSWFIGLLDYLGSKNASVWPSLYTKNEFGGLTDKRNKWNYFNEINWIQANPNDIAVQCKGKNNSIIVFMTYFGEGELRLLAFRF